VSSYPKHKTTKHTKSFFSLFHINFVLFSKLTVYQLFPFFVFFLVLNMWDYRKKTVISTTKCFYFGGFHGILPLLKPPEPSGPFGWRITTTFGWVSSKLMLLIRDRRRSGRFRSRSLKHKRTSQFINVITPMQWGNIKKLCNNIFSSKIWQKYFFLNIHFAYVANSWSGNVLKFNSNWIIFEKVGQYCL
jgi:hypothetical protein